MGFAMLLVLPAMLFVGTLLDVATSDDSPDHDPTEPEGESPAVHGDLLDGNDAAA